MWQIDSETIKFANSSAKKRIKFLYDVFNKNLRSITRTYK